MINNQPIGVLDSGVGGLTVLKQLIKRLPNEKFVFIGDQKRMPYGSKSREEVIQFTRQMIKFLLSKNVKAIIFACNTATAEALDVLKSEVDVPLIGVIKSGSEDAVEATKKNVGVIATQGTVLTGMYEKEILKLNSDLKVYSKAAPKFVPMIESGNIDSLEVSRVLNYFDDKKIETLVLGCTHYPIILSEIDNYFNGKIKIIDPSFKTTEKLAEVLDKKDIHGNSKQEISFFTTGDSNNFDKFIFQILNIKIPQSRSVNIEK
ncbi:glutamate racemase [Companilactobacillus sp. DQM5]|uniref:glutamate racemase n=1 Tax=Companilactobacillus sp. DQM5 TaxID=3463359 RepID=UPI004058B12D